MTTPCVTNMITFMFTSNKLEALFFIWLSIYVIIAHTFHIMVMRASQQHKNWKFIFRWKHTRSNGESFLIIFSSSCLIFENYTLSLFIWLVIIKINIIFAFYMVQLSVLWASSTVHIIFKISFRISIKQIFLLLMWWIADIDYHIKMHNI